VSLQKGKQGEFEELLERFADFIRIHIRKFNLSRFGLDPEDISQEINIKIWKLLNNEKVIDNYPSYIKKIVHSSVIDLLRKWKREDRVFLQEKQKKISETKRDYHAGCQQEDQMKEAIAEATNSLIESRRKVVKLFLLDMNIEEISAFYNWSQNKTRNLLYRGLSDLRNILKDKDIDYENKQ
jgi:RNA polymerase sigma-70 factor (ECF subfamily)